MGPLFCCAFRLRSAPTVIPRGPFVRRGVLCCASGGGASGVARRHSGGALDHGHPQRACCWALPCSCTVDTARGASPAPAGANGQTGKTIQTRRHKARAVLNGEKKKRKSVPVPVFPKKSAGTPCAQPWLVAVGGWQLAAVGGWWLAAALGIVVFVMVAS